MLKEIVFSDLGKLCTPAEAISPLREMHKWNSVPYETDRIQGTMLVALQDSRPEEVSLNPKLTGWYRIFVGLGASTCPENNTVNLKLGSEDVYMHIMHSEKGTYAARSISECYWCSADMTGETIQIGKHARGSNVAFSGDALLAWLRFEPMTEEEITAFQADQARMDTKRIYATNDMYGMLYLYGPDKQEEWYSFIKDYAQSDVEWLSLENLMIFDGEPSTGDVENFAFPFPIPEYKAVQERLKRCMSYERYGDLVSYGHKQGLRMCLSMRMGAWGIEFPCDQMFFTNSFHSAHPEYRCVDRDGTVLDALSYMYPQVQEYIINEFVQLAKQGCDAVEMMYHRGVPYILFEEPFVARFQERYGEDPRCLPLDDVRVTDLRCEIMNDFVRKLRRRLDETVGKDGIRLHARVQYSLWDCRHVAVDVETWAKEGLIDAVISYPQRIREVLTGDVWQDENPQLLDLKKYSRYVRESETSIIDRRQDFNFIPPMEDSRGVLRGPKDPKERALEFLALERDYGVTVYLEIMPRLLSPEEYRERALELYSYGCEHISLWDTYNRVPRKVPWSMIRRLGHKEELEAFDSGEGTYYRNVRLLKIGGKDVSRYMPAWGG